MTNQTEHLNDDQFAECLGEELQSPSVSTTQIRAHLAACEQCRAEMDMFMTSVEGFEEAAMGWTKSQPAFSPRAVLAARQRTKFQAVWSMPLRLATAAVFLLAVGATAMLHREHTAPADRATVTAADSAAQIAEDNQLLQSVNLALGETDPSPFDVYGLTDTKTAKPQAEVRSQ